MDDTRAFGRLVEATREPLLRFLLNLTGGDTPLADDLAQNAYIKAWTHLSAFRATSRFRTWLTSIALNEYYSWLRAGHSDLGLDDVAPSDVPDDSADATRVTDARLDAAAALALLSPLDRSLVLLFYMEDLPVKKISRITGLTETNVKTRLHRAKSRMAKYLSEK